MSIIRNAILRALFGGELPMRGGGLWTGNSLKWIWHQGSRKNWTYEADDVHKNNVVFIGARRLASAIAEANLVVQQIQPDGTWKPAKSMAAQDVVQAIKEPNALYSGTAMLKGSSISWIARGDFHWFIRVNQRGKAVGFTWIPHWQIKPKIENDVLVAWEYTPKAGGGTIDLDPTQVIHVRDGIDPEDPWRGLSQLQATMRDITAENDAAGWLPARLGGASPRILSPKPTKEGPSKDVPPEMLSQYSDRLNEYVRDAGGRIAVMPFPVEMAQMDWSPQEMQIGDLRAIPTARICAAMGFDPMALGLPSENKTYSNYGEAMDAAGKTTILPTMGEWSEQLSKQILPLFGLDSRNYRIWWDYSNVSWLQDETDALHTRYRENFKVGGLDLARFKELIGETPAKTDAGITFFDLQARTMPAVEPKPKEEQKHGHSALARRMVEASKGYEPIHKDRDPVPAPESLQGDHDGIVRRTFRRLRAQAEKYGLDEIKEEAFLEQFSRILLGAHADAYRLGEKLAGAEASEAAKEAAQRIVDLEQPFIQGLAGRIREGVYSDDEGFQIAKADPHLRLYASKVGSTANAGFVDASDDDEEFDWQLTGGEEHCQDCPYIASGSPYTKATLFSVPRDGQTACVSNCTCRLKRRSDGKQGFAPIEW